MKGQWRGRFKSGEDGGEIVVELDEFSDNFRGHAFLYRPDGSLPCTLAVIRTPNEAATGRFQTQLYPLDAGSHEVVPWETMAPKFPNVEWPPHAEVTYRWTDAQLNLNWKTAAGVAGQATIDRPDPSRASELIPLAEVASWQDFKAFAVGLEYGRYVFRGQAKPWRLRTSFHRTGRGDVWRYAFVDDIPTLHRNLSARTRHFYDLKDPEQNGAFYNLVQHHGYPTPLMDWTLSPFVGAFFAYHKIRVAETEAASADAKVRIFMFDERQWVDRWRQVPNLRSRHPHFSVLKPLAIGNERMVPQQALSTLTNIDDVEAYIRTKEVEAGTTYLQAIDLPVLARHQVMRELSLMGITAGSMFPGLDGACEELRERFFDI